MVENQWSISDLFFFLPLLSFHLLLILLLSLLACWLFLKSKKVKFWVLWTNAKRYMIRTYIILYIQCYLCMLCFSVWRHTQIKSCNFVSFEPFSSCLFASRILIGDCPQNVRLSSVIMAFYTYTHVSVEI